MQSVTLTQTGTGQDEFIFDRGNAKSTGEIGFGVTVSGTVTYSVQHTFDETNWFDHASATGKSAAFDGSYLYPVRGIRINVTAGTGTATMTALIGGL
jgi:hypothetical protein